MCSVELTICESNTKDRIGVNLHRIWRVSRRPGRHKSLGRGDHSYHVLSQLSPSSNFSVRRDGDFFCGRGDIINLIPPMTFPYCRGFLKGQLRHSLSCNATPTDAIKTEVRCVRSS